jgi:hypothetical protein
MKDNENIMANINRVREDFVPVANRVARLFFVLV